MKKLISESKTIEDALEKLLDENKITKEEILYSKEVKKGHLLKGDTYIIKAYLKEDLLKEVIEYLKIISEGLNAEIKSEILTQNERTVIKLYSENNSILIGKNGQTLKAMETLVKQKIYVETGINFKISIDVENYKEKRDARIIKLAKISAKEVLESNISVQLDSMTSYERRLVHEALSEFKGIKTHSEGEEPNRYTIIEPE